VRACGGDREDHEGVCRVREKPTECQDVEAKAMVSLVEVEI